MDHIADAKTSRNCICCRWKRYSFFFFRCSSRHSDRNIFTEVDILNKYKLWSSFYIVTLVYIYVTRIIVQLLQASLSFKYVTWLGEAVDEVATLLFYVFIGYKFRPFPNNPYTQVPDEDFDEENDASYRSGGGGADAAEDNSLRMYPISRTRNISDKTSKNHSTDSL